MIAQDVFAAPKTEVRDVEGGVGLVTDLMVSSLRRTRPWLLLVAILGFISAVLVAIMAIPMLLGGSMLEAELTNTGAFGVGLMRGMGVFYLIIALISCYASWHLLRFAGAIQQVLSTLSAAALEIALQRQASFWRLVGLLTLTSIALVIGLIVVAVVLAIP